ncbi:DUF2190 family protein [Agromyces indicus]|uniref:DUF2190 family protein n=1 Tax=Agromyces indicus TaxID=758919 RepID=A0ABU1FJJ8_9MICO|nr:DUF2190 family protein [Agromyces indicus]MDR5691908.1 DUF2190 family protein [Agromyces indicus]
MVDYLPKFNPGAAATFTAAADVIGGRLVAAVGDRLVEHTGADDSRAIGVAGNDAAEGELVVVFTRAGGVHGLIPAGTILPGDKVTSAADGQVAALGAGSFPIGLALTGSSPTVATVDVLFV